MLSKYSILMLSPFAVNVAGSFGKQVGMIRASRLDFDNLGMVVVMGEISLGFL